MYDTITNKKYQRIEVECLNPAGRRKKVFKLLSAPELEEQLNQLAIKGWLKVCVILDGLVAEAITIDKSQYDPSSVQIGQNESP